MALHCDWKYTSEFMWCNLRWIFVKILIRSDLRCYLKSLFVYFFFNATRQQTLANVTMPRKAWTSAHHSFLSMCFSCSVPPAVKWHLAHRWCIAPICLTNNQSPTVFSWRNWKTGLLANTNVPSFAPPRAPLGSGAHKLEEKSNFPVGLLGSDCTQTHCFSLGAVDFYSSWCKWVDKTRLGTGLRFICLLTHCRWQTNSALVILQCTWPARVRVASSWRDVAFLKVELSWLQPSCTLEQCYRRKQLDGPAWEPTSMRVVTFDLFIIVNVVNVCSFWLMLSVSDLLAFLQLCRGCYVETLLASFAPSHELNSCECENLQSSPASLGVVKLLSGVP